MKKNLAIIAVCVAIISIIIGTAGFNFTGVRSMAEDVEDTSNNLTYDITSISVFAFCVKDFFEGWDFFNVYLEEELAGSGSFNIVYASGTKKQVGSGTVFEIYREERFPLSTTENPMTWEDAQKAIDRIEYPIRPFTEWEREPYKGIFAEVLNALQYVAYIIGMIWGALSLVLLVLIDTVVTAWELIRVAMRFVGLM